MTNRLRERACLSVLIALLGACAHVATPDDSPAAGLRAISGGRVIASVLDIALNCERFEGMLITTIGIGTFEFENHTLCPSADLAIDPLNCLWLSSHDLPRHVYEQAVQESRAAWIVDGYVECGEVGHMGLHPAELVRLQSIIQHEKSIILWQR
jgi:hypothetical protein